MLSYLPLVYLAFCAGQRAALWRPSERSYNFMSVGRADRDLRNSFLVAIRFFCGSGGLCYVQSGFLRYQNVYENSHSAKARLF